MKKTVIFSVIIFLALSLSSLGGEIEKRLKNKGLHVAELTDTDMVDLQINRLQQAIQQQWTGVVLEMLSDSYMESDPTITRTSMAEGLQRLFSAVSQVRHVSARTNPETGWRVTSTQDFYIQSVKIHLQGDKAVAECEAGLYSAPEDYRKIKETLSFVLKDRAWLLAGSENLFGFLGRAAKTPERQIGAPDSMDRALAGAKDDFVSTHMLVPVTLFFFDGDPVPRFNKTESMRWFWGFYPPFWYPLNVMNYPYGIVADVLVTPGGAEEFNHEFLFVSDVTADKILATQMNEWIAEFGTQGGGENQFWGPHGMASLLSCYYFVAEKLNNRVSVYYFENGFTHPRWEFALEAGFNHPRDVDVKEARPRDLQDKTYIAVADMYNHRVVIFRWPHDFNRSYGQPGSGEGQFLSPTSVCFGRDPEWGFQTDDLFVTDKGNHRLVRIYIGTENTLWRGCYQFPDDVELTSVQVDNKGLIYVVDRQNGKVYKLAPSQDYPYYFSLLGIWGEKGTQDGQLYYPNTLQVAHGRYVYDPQHSGDWVPLTGLGDVFVTESWGDQTGVRRFVIAADVVNMTAGWVPYNEDTGEGNYIWWDYGLTDFGTVTEEVLRGAEVCTTYNRGVLNWGNQGGAWPVDGHPHGAYYTVKVTATSIYAPTIVVEKSVDVYVDTLTIHNPVITQGIRCNHDNPLPFWCDGCYQCIKEYQEYTIDVQAYDPDGGPLTYEWSCAQGYFDDGSALYKEITTSENYVCYYAPLAPGGAKPPIYEAITVFVRNSIGGEALDRVIMDSYLYPSETTCLCGDANDDGIVNVGDVSYIVSYLYKGGPAPPDPIERGDVNNDCIVDAGDMVYLVNYLYKGGPAPKCCWLHE